MTSFAWDTTSFSGSYYSMCGSEVVTSYQFVPSYTLEPSVCPSISPPTFDISVTLEKYYSSGTAYDWEHTSNQVCKLDLTSTEFTTVYD